VTLQRRCGWCDTVLEPGVTPETTGICPVCVVVYFQLYRPALMPPKADRYDDCLRCRLKDVDREGIPDGCGALIGEPCIAPGKRSPWDGIKTVRI
jgi:hypothetical protein